MPKKPKSRSTKKGKDGSGGSDDNESVINDNMSVISNASADSYMKDFEGGGNTAEEDGNEDLTQSELFEEKLRETIDLATQKSANGRVEALKALSKAFGKKFVPEFVDNQKLTIQDAIEKSLKKGKGAERVAAANLVTSLCIQLRGEADDLYRDIKPIFVTLMTDNSAALQARIAIANNLGDICFLAAPAMAEVEAVMEIFEQIFTKQSSGGVELLPLCTAALSSWTLLATVLPFSRVYDLLLKHGKHFGMLLDAPDVDLRIATGEAIAVLYEFVTDSDDFEGSDGEEGDGDDDKEELQELIEELSPKLKQLSTDSQKFRSKKDRKEQKHSFRDILRTIEEGDGYYEKVVINKREKLEIDSWAMKKQYEMVCKALSSGSNLHLTENELIRGVFELGAPIPSLASVSTNVSKAQRQIANQQAFKWRTQTRGKNRDKRSAVI